MDSQIAKPKSVQVRYNEINVTAGLYKPRNWKPFAIKTPFLVFVAAVLILCTIALEILLRNAVPLGRTVTQSDVSRRQFTPTKVATSRILNPTEYLSLSTTTSTSSEDYSPPGTIKPTKTNEDEYLKLNPTLTPSAPSIPSVPTTPPSNPPPVQAATTTAATGPAVVPQSSTVRPVATGAPSQPTVEPVVSYLTSVYTSNSKQYTSVVTVSSSTKPQSPLVPSGTSVEQEISEVRRPDSQIEGNVTEVWYFTAIYVPSIIAVVVRELWLIISCGLKMMEPFFLLNEPDGAIARDTLLADYLSPVTSWRTLSNAARGNKFMIIIQIGVMITSFLAPVATESMTIAVLSKVTDSSGVTRRSNAAWALNRFFTRLLQGMFSSLAILVILVAILGWNRHSGLSANPSKIATMASLLNQPSAFQDIRTIHSPTSSRESTKSIARNRYKIVRYQDQCNNDCCGLIKINATESVEPQRTTAYGREYEGGTEPTLVNNHGPWQSESNISRRLSDSILLIFVIGLLGVLVTNYIATGDSGFNAWFNSGEFGPKFVMSLGASLATMLFQNIEREVRLAIPYKRLAARQAPPESTILRSVNGTAASSILQSIRHATWFHFVIAISTILGDVLIIVIVGVPFSDNLTLQNFNRSNWLSIGLLVLMLAATIAVFMWRRKNKKLNLPQRSNDTLIQVWASVSNSENQIRALLSDAGNMTETQLKARLKQDGGRYWAGWVNNGDNRDVWCVDREEDHSTRHGSARWETQENERRSFLTY